MTYDINKLRAISKATSTTINSKLGGEDKYQEDPRFWALTKNEKTKTGQALIRFLPSLSEDKLPFVATYSYFIQCDNGWYVAKSLKTIGQKDPMGDYIHELWKKAKSTNDEGLADQLRKKYRERLQYISNILVVNDPDHPENNGKVFLFKYGKKIYDKIVSKMRDDGLGESCNIFDWTEGANFKLRMKTIDKFPNYDSSEFSSSSSLSDDEIVRIANQMYDLGEFTDPSKFKSYDELKERLNKVCNVMESTTLTASSNSFETPTRSSEKDEGFGEDDDEPFTYKGSGLEATETKAEKTPWDDDNDVDFASLKDEIDTELKG